MKIKNLLCSISAVVIAAGMLAVTASAALLEGNGDDIKKLKMFPDPNTDYAKVASIEAVITTDGTAAGALGATTLENQWKQQPFNITNETYTCTLSGLSGIVAIESEMCIQVDFWSASGTYSVDSVKLFDADGKEILPGDTAVERPELKFDDAKRPNIDNEKFGLNGKLDIEQAVGADFGEIGAIDATIKWDIADSAWNGGAGLSGVTYADGTDEWLASVEIGNCNENEALLGTTTETTYRLYDFSANPITGLTSTGVTGEISGYATMNIDMWWTSGAAPQLSNVTIYDTDGNVLASLDYETDYDVPADTQEDTQEETEETGDSTSEETNEAETEESSDIGDNNTDDETVLITPATEKGNPDTGVAGLTASFLALILAGTAVVASSKKK